VGGSFDVGLSPDQYQAILTNNIFFRQDLELDPGTYDVDLIVRDRLSGKVAAKRAKLVLADGASEFSATEVVLSRHAEPAGAGAAETGDVFSAGPVRIRPSPSREFRASDELIVFLNLYNAASDPATGKPSVRVSVTLTNGGTPARRPVTYEVTESAAEPVPHLTFARYIELEGLPAGTYSAVIEARDMVTRKLLKQEASFVITR
jgi:hypothetical protein